MAVITSLQIGKVVTEGDANARGVTDRRWTSAFRKRPVDQSVVVETLGIHGDEVADTKNHGGTDKAILCYARLHYEQWRSEYPELDFGPGGFGENLTLDGVSEADVCIGDRWQTLDCEFEVSQPRQPCWKIARRWKTKSLTKEVAQTGRTGWYLRVTRGGTLAAGENLTLSDRPHPAWTVKRANDLLYRREVDADALNALRSLGQLSSEWKQSLR